MSERLTCVLCPLGCELDAEPAPGGGLEVRNAQCDKGRDFAIEEVLRPKRNLATSVLLEGPEPALISVRLSAPVPRDRIFPILAEIAKLGLEPPVARGQILIRDVLGTGADVIATRGQVLTFNMCSKAEPSERPGKGKC